MIGKRFEGIAAILICSKRIDGNQPFRAAAADRGGAPADHWEGDAGFHPGFQDAQSSGDSLSRSWTGSLSAKPNTQHGLAMM